MASMDFQKEINKFPVSSISNWAAERKFYGRFYLSQGFNDKKGFTNDCGPTSLAIILNLFLFQENPRVVSVEKNNVIHSSNFHYWERLPYWIPRFGGATAPWGIVKAFNRWAKHYDLNWQAQRKIRARKAHVLENLLMGKPVTVLKIWKSGGAHWINLVRYSSEKGRLYYLDPNPFLEYLPEGKRLQSQTWEDFEADWSRTNWWSKLLRIKKEMIVYSRIS